MPAGSRSSSSRRISACISFIDLAGFTALTEAHGDEDAADLALRFAELTRRTLAPDDRLVKTIGDAVLVTSPTAASGVALVEQLVTLAAGEPGFPSLRAGMHFGPAIERDADVFGAAVNLAARVAAEAHAGEVICTESVARAAEESGIPVAELGAVILKNVQGAIPLYSLGLIVGATETPVDPVCQAAVDRRGAAGMLTYRGKEYWFCSLTCAAAFASNPRWHVEVAKTA